MIRYIVFFVILWFFVPTSTQAASILQAKIDAASKGAIIEIEQGKYEEMINISKPITLIGNGDVILYSCEEGPVVNISGKNVTLKDIKVVHCGNQDGNTAIRVTGSNHTLEELHIETKKMGIRLENTRNVSISSSEIIGKWQGNGIDLWNASGNTLTNNTISNVYDGIYLERSNFNHLSGNEIRTSRYGTHVMFSDDNILDENILNSNITGTMVMSSKRTLINHNTFAFSRNNVNAQGLLLYMAVDTQVTNNEFISNRVGIYTEKSENNRIYSNMILDNFIGIQFEKASNNSAVRNHFIGNVNDAQAVESTNNEIKHNYWDSANKIDGDGDGFSDIAFVADPYFLLLTTEVPEYQLFFHSPGLILIQKMLKSPVHQLLVDSSPLMDIAVEMRQEEKSSYFSLWFIGCVMILSSASLFTLGRKKS